MKVTERLKNIRGYHTCGDQDHLPCSSCEAGLMLDVLETGKTSCCGYCSATNDGTDFVRHLVTRHGFEEKRAWEIVFSARSFDSEEIQ